MNWRRMSSPANVVYPALAKCTHRMRAEATHWSASGCPNAISASGNAGSRRPMGWKHVVDSAACTRRCAPSPDWRADSARPVSCRLHHTVSRLEVIGASLQRRPSVQPVEFLSASVRRRNFTQSQLSPPSASMSVEQGTSARPYRCCVHRSMECPRTQLEEIPRATRTVF